MNNKEIELEKSKSGYSETQQALDIEMRSGDLSSLKKSKSFQSLSNIQKTLAAYQTISHKLNELIDAYVQLTVDNPHRAQKLLTEIAELKGVQEVLFTELVGVCAVKHTKEQAEIKIKELVG